ncbi:MAG: alginate lyase family protein [Gemmatimonadota bacterium]|nr:alginate lyase family protein [Gemmatimonadota bacterium]
MTGVLVDRTPRPVFCVIDHACRDLAVAEAVTTGRFTHVGLTLALGVEPDWRGAPFPVDKEWRIEWSKFYFGLDLAHAFAETGDPVFLHSWERLVRSWIRQVPADHDRSDITARRIQNWIYAWVRFRAAGAALPETLVDAVLASLAAQVAFVRANLTAERNHRTLELYALLVAALALPALDPEGELREFATEELSRNLLDDILPDGVHREQSTHYHCVALRTYLGARQNAEQFGYAFSAAYDARLVRACEFALHCHRPDGEIPAFSDSDTGSYHELFALAAQLFDRPDFRYVASRGGEGTAPRERSASFPAGGYFMQRSGWGEERAFHDERFLMLDCGPLGAGGHGHYDLLSVELAAGGRPLIVDPGRYTYSDEAPDWRRWFKGTAAHNTVLVDGLDQTPYRRSKPRGAPATGRLLGRWGAPGLDLIVGEAVSPAYDARHVRSVLFVADEYWLLHDRLTAATNHTYDLRFHLTPAAEGRTEVFLHRGQWVVRAPGLLLLVEGATRPRLEQGWYAPAYGVRHAAPVVSVSRHAAHCDFLTLILPDDATSVIPSLEVHSWGNGDGRLTIDLTGVAQGTATDRLVWGDLHETITPQDPAIRWSRRDASGRHQQQAAVERLG